MLEVGNSSELHNYGSYADETFSAERITDRANCKSNFNNDSPVQETHTHTLWKQERFEGRRLTSRIRKESILKDVEELDSPELGTEE